MHTSTEKRIDLWTAHFKSRLDGLKDSGEYRVFRTIERVHGDNKSWTTRFSNSDIISFCSNDYLAMSMHPLVVNTAINTLRTSGVGAGGSRNIGGTFTTHHELENELADLHRYDSGLIFTSGYLANYVPLLTLGTQVPDLIFYSDEANHASMIDAIGAVTRDNKLNCDKRIFKHNDVKDLERLLSADDPNRPKAIVFESVYSMDADLSPIKEICELAERYNSLIFLNEVHAVGIYGPEGSGVFNTLSNVTQPHITVGTLGKSFGTIGGYMVGSEETVDFVRSYGRGFIFTTSLPPALTTAATSAIRHLRQSKLETDALWERVKLLKLSLIERKIPYIGASHIIPIVIGDAKKSIEVSNRLLKEGFLVTAVNYPTVPRGTERLRVTVTPAHAIEDVERFVEALDALWEEYQFARRVISTK